MNQQPVKTQTEHDKSIPALIELLESNENCSKIVRYLYFFGGLGAAHFSQNNQKIYKLCSYCPKNNKQYDNKTCFSLFGILKGELLKIIKNLIGRCNITSVMKRILPYLEV